MKPITRRLSFLIYYFIFYFVCWPVLAHGGDLSSNLPSGPPSQSLPVKVAVLPLSDGRVKSETVEKVADTLRDELRHKDRLEVLSKVETEKYLASSPTLLAAGDSSNTLNRYLDQAREFYKNFQFRDAVGLLENTIDSYRRSTGALVQLFLLTDAYLMLGNIHLGDNDPRRAEEAFREAVRLDPDRMINDTQYPPKTVALFEKTRQDFLKKAKSVFLEIQSSPAKAEVFVNGDKKGPTPLSLERFTSGEHFVLVQAPGYKPLGLRLQLKNPENRERVVLEKATTRVADARGLNVTNLEDVPEQVRWATVVGKSLGVDKVVLVSVQEIGWNNKITARMVDLKYQASHKPKSVEVLDLPKDTRSAAQVIASDLQQSAALDLAKDPKKYADSDVMVIGTKKKKSFLKSPILWSLVGVLVAGGAATAFLIGKGGGGGGSDNGATVSLSGSSSKAP